MSGSVSRIRVATRTRCIILLYAKAGDILRGNHATSPVCAKYPGPFASIAQNVQDRLRRSPGKVRKVSRTFCVECTKYPGPFALCAQTKTGRHPRVGDDGP